MDGSTYPILYGGQEAGGFDYETWAFGGGDYFTVEPDIVSVEDVPNDQGREVAVLWERSYLDAPAFQIITYYSIWRKYPQPSMVNLAAKEWDGAALRKGTQCVCRRIESQDPQANGRG